MIKCSLQVKWKWQINARKETLFISLMKVLNFLLFLFTIGRVKNIGSHLPQDVFVFIIISCTSRFPLARVFNNFFILFPMKFISSLWLSIFNIHLFPHPPVTLARFMFTELGFQFEGDSHSIPTKYHLSFLFQPKERHLSWLQKLLFSSRYLDKEFGVPLTKQFLHEFNQETLKENSAQIVIVSKSIKRFMIFNRKEQRLMDELNKFDNSKTIQDKS